MHEKVLDLIPELDPVFRSIRNYFQYLFEVPYRKKVKDLANTIAFNHTVSLTNCKFDVFGDNNTILIQDFASMNNVRFCIKGSNNKILIANEVEFHRSGEILIEGESCEARIGEKTTFEKILVYVTERSSKVSIGNNCIFSHSIDITTGDSHHIFDAEDFRHINYSKNVSISDNVWVAPHVSIQKGASISANSLVASGTVVTKKFMQEDVFLAGNPAKITKKNGNRKMTSQ